MEQTYSPHIYIYMADCTDRDTDRFSPHRNTDTTISLILLLYLAEQDGPLVRAYICIHVCTRWIPPAAGLTQSQLRSCLWIPVSLVADIWTYEPQRPQPHSLC